ncbi:dTDP-4-dehydrorhamnose reductase [Bordetella ansorpii]|uniref:dTDP-4-dehydrorhamnose reductase n=1 Tax=Bordetella ansorpii TaxID=288768 RepID=A0A157S9T5_9BORD|nr:dTDP-4-dehydrorhamnose reductase [Bordetella ansorpii]SAI67182.1 dTDP-4-dehydrorhamnose reductase [Bordetella ansorpii]
MKLLLLGAAGQMGQALLPALRRLGDLTALGRAQADLTQIQALRDVVDAIAPDVIVNAAAYTAVDRAEHQQALARQINAEAVAVLADIARERDALLVHYSSDYVFDGRKAGAYVESDAAHPLNVYGQTKLAGDNAVRESGCRALVLRTSWVYATHGENFVRTVLKLAATQNTLRMVSDQVGAPVSADRLAAVSVQAIVAHQAGLLASGLYHLAPTGAVDRHGLACHIVERARAHDPALGLRLENIEAIPTPDDPALARRPRNSRLDSSALSRALGIALPDWREDLDAAIQTLMRSNLR